MGKLGLNFAEPDASGEGSSCFQNITQALHFRAQRKAKIARENPLICELKMVACMGKN